MSDHSPKIEKIISELISLIDPTATCFIEKQEDGYFIQIDTEPSGAFIGYHGEALKALQTIVSIIVYKQVGEDVRVTLNVADYQQQREEKLKDISEKALEIVRNTQSSYTLPYLDGKERRYVHLYLSEIRDIRTESIGEGLERRLVVFPETV